MKILFVAHYPGFYGANKSLCTLITFLRSKYKIEPIVLLPSQGPMCDILTNEGVKFIVSRYYWWVNYNKGLFQYFLNKRKQIRNVIISKRISKQLSQQKIDLVYSNSVTIDMGLLIAGTLRVPHIWQFRESLVQYNLSLSLSLSLTKRIFRDSFTKKYILISDYMMDYYKPYLPNERMTRIYNGISAPSKLQTASPFLSNRINLCVVGVICEQKNQEDAIRAVRILLDKGYDVVLHLIGTGQQTYLDKIQKLSNSLNMSNNVIFHGHKDNVWELLSFMDIGLNTFNSEAFGRTTIEYMLCGIPVVASNSGANPELVHDGNNGLLYQIGSSEDLASKIEYFILNKEEAIRIGLVGMEYAKTKYNADKNAEMIYEQISEVLDS